MRKLLILGAGGLGLEVVQYVHDLASDNRWNYELCGFVDDRAPIGTAVENVPVIGSTEKPPQIDADVLIAVGDAEARYELHRWVSKNGYGLASLIHPTAFVAESAEVGPGSIVGPHTTVAARASIGANVLMNVYSSVGHESTVGNHSVLSPYAAILGQVTFGEVSLIATRSTVLPKLKVGSRSKISAHSLVTRDVSSFSLAIGNPARSRVIFADPKLTAEQPPGSSSLGVARTNDEEIA